MKTLLAIVLITILVVWFRWIYRFVYRSSILYRWDGKNPYRRTCKKCGAVQEMWQDLFGTWWEEAITGNNPNCICRKDTEDINHFV